MLVNLKLSQSEVERYNLKLLPFSVCFLLLSLILSYLLGGVGFILANMGNMAIRIFFSMRLVTTMLPWQHGHPFLEHDVSYHPVTMATWPPVGVQILLQLPWCTPWMAQRSR